MNKDQIKKDYPAEGPVQWQKRLIKKLKEKDTDISSSTGTQRWKLFLPIVQLPVWLAAVETIRRMCGTQEGLLGLIRKSAALDHLGNLPVDHIPEASVIPAEPSLGTEGALWFPDLIAPDPYLILPVFLSASLYAIQAQKEANKNLNIHTRRLSHLLRIVALATGPLTLSFPSAIHLYWLSSSVSGLILHIVKDRYLATLSGPRFRRLKGRELAEWMKSDEGQRIRRVVEQMKKDKDKR
ncbi:MAG: hypothetical protein Q9201_001933 [Fulgogasparrea decipioides]